MALQRAFSQNDNLLVAVIDGATPEEAEATAEALAGSTALVAFLLFLPLRRWRLIVPVLLTLAQGLLLTIGFAALAVGMLNLVSVAFAVLFVGIAVDFGIQLAARFREERLNTPSLPGVPAARCWSPPSPAPSASWRSPSPTSWAWRSLA